MFLTRCPHCRTTFRLNEAQLMACDGRVRCGACKQVFNAQENLQETAPVATKPQVAQERPAPQTNVEDSPDALLTRTLILMPDVSPPSEAEARFSGANPAAQPSSHAQSVDNKTETTAFPPLERLEWTKPCVMSPPQRAPDPPRKPAPLSEASPMPVPEKAFHAAPSETQGLRNPQSLHGGETRKHVEKIPVSREPTRQPAPAASPRTSQRVQDLSRHSTWSSSLLDDLGETSADSIRPFILTAIFLGLILCAQAAYYHRGALSQRMPVVAQICRTLNLSVPFPRERERISIEEFDMKNEIDPARPDEALPSRLRFMLTLRNNAAYPQAWPHLEITLSDIHGALLARKALPPREYLPPDAAAGFPSGNMPIHLLLDKGGLPTFSYQIDFFYP